MGQCEVRRVPLDFDAPLKEVWPGYLLPDDLLEDRCGDCDGRGMTTARCWVEHLMSMVLMLNTDLNDQARGRPMHPYFDGVGHYGGRPSPDIFELVHGLAGRGDPGGWSDALDRWAATKNLIRAAGLDPEVWGICVVCAGHGTVERHPGQRVAADAWEIVEPPVGVGWQLWETTSEGSPVSPVFAAAEELAGWCETGATWFGDARWTRAQWLESFLAGTTERDSLLVSQGGRFGSGLDMGDDHH